MNITKFLAQTILAVGCLAASTGLAAEKPVDPAAGKKPEAPVQKAKPYALKTCIVSDEKLGEMGDPFVFTYKGREIKMCCEGCRKDFDKNPAKFVKKLEAEEKKAAKKPVDKPAAK